MFVYLVILWAAHKAWQGGSTVVRELLSSAVEKKKKIRRKIHFVNTLNWKYTVSTYILIEAEVDGNLVGFKVACW